MELPIHRQRTAVLFVGALAVGLCFLPLGHFPLVWNMHGILLARKAAIALYALIAIFIVLGRRRRPSSLPVQIGSLAGLCALIGFCTFRIVVLAQRPMPTFADDDPAASAYYQKTCDQGRMEACSMLGTCYWTGTCGVAKAVAKGLALFEKACDGGEMAACGQLGVCYEFGGCNLMKSGERAVAFYEKACNGGDMSMCNNLGVCYYKGECGVGKDDSRAVALYTKACRGGDSGACHNLGLIKN
jgi:TPR repeat protein